MAPDETRETSLAEYRRKARPIAVDGLLWLTVIAFLLIVFGALKVLEAAGYSKTRIEFLENIHYIGSAGVLIMFSYDMLMKVVSFDWQR